MFCSSLVVSIVAAAISLPWPVVHVRKSLLFFFTDSMGYLLWLLVRIFCLPLTIEWLRIRHDYDITRTFVWQKDYIQCSMAAERNLLL